MLNGLYSSASALDVATRTHEMVAHNLAHVNVPGFRRTVARYQTFEMSLDENLQTGAPSGTSLEGMHTDFTPGPMESTGRSLDLAIQGDGLFVLNAEDGSPLYTRNGIFHLDDSGRLVNASGFVVRGTSGGISVPPGTAPSDIRVTKDGSIWVPSSDPNSADMQVGQLQISVFPDTEQLVPAGTTTFAATPDAVVLTAAEASVVQGVREGSNVAPVSELVQLMGDYRYFEASQRAMSAIADAVGQNTNPNA